MKRPLPYLLAVLVLSACKGEIVEQGVLVTVDNKSGATAIVQLRAKVSNQDRDETLLLPDTPRPTPLKFPTRFSISVPSSRSGRVDITIDGLDASATPLATGVSYAILQGSTFVPAAVDLGPVAPSCGSGGSCSDASLGPEAGADADSGGPVRIDTGAVPEVPGAADGARGTGGEVGSGGTGGAGPGGACGQPGSQCCDGNACGPGLACSSGTCSATDASVQLDAPIAAGDGGAAGTSGGFGGTAGAATGGSAGAGSGGAAGARTGGAAGGGVSGSGGVTSSGGLTGTGGMAGGGGLTGTGGIAGSGGTVGTGGIVGTGGTVGSGGTIGTGGAVGTGGTPGSGGAAGTAAGGTAGTGATAGAGAGGTSGSDAAASGGAGGTGGTVCTPNQPACHDNTATTCNTDGSGYLAGGTDCSLTSQICNNGTCVSQVCVPKTYYCDGNTVRHCSSDGLSSAIYQTCTTSQYCDSASKTCKAQRCTPDQPTCDANVATTCNADGSGYLGGGTDCTSRGQLCSAGACIGEQTDVIGNIGSSSSTSAVDYYKLDVYSVTSSRTLTQIEQYMDIGKSAPVTFLVYESTTQSGTYTLISSPIVTVSVGTGYISSGPVSVSLVAGRFYLIGVWWGTSAEYYYVESVSGGTSIAQATSFGSLIDTTNSTASSAPTSIAYTYSSTTSYRYPQRLHTGP